MYVVFAGALQLKACRFLCRPGVVTFVVTASGKKHEEALNPMVPFGVILGFRV